MAFQPMFLFLSASLSNDLAVAATAAYALAYTTFLITKKWRPRAYIIWGFLYALALLTKTSAVLLILPLLIACFARWRETGRPRIALSSGLAAVDGFAPLYSIWFIISQTSRSDTLDVSSIVPISRIIKLGISDISAMRPYLLQLWKSFWLDWSAGEIGYTSDKLYLLGGFVLLLLLVGWIRRPPRTWNNKILAWMHIIWPLPLIAIFIGVKTLMVKEAGFLVPEGRWLLPILPSLAWLAGNGWSRWWSEKRRPAANNLAAGIASASTLIFMFIIIPNAYPLPKKLADIDQIPNEAEPVGILFDNQISLSAVQSNEFVNDRDTTVKYFWRAEDDIKRDFSVVSILVTEMADDWQIVDRKQTHPGNGLAPTKGWEQGELYTDQITLRPRMQLLGPSLASLVVELSDGDMPLEAVFDGKIIDSPVVKQIVIRPEESLEPDHGALLEDPVNFGDLFDLIGLSMSVAGDELSASLWWESNASPDSDYTVFIHLLDEQGELLAQSDSMPNRNLSPTHIWEPGDIIQDVHVLTSASSLGAKIRIGVYDPATLNRLAASQDSGRLEADIYDHRLP
jgi:hypothetical protein